MNLPLPSGSSPPEKPPGNAIICAASMRFFISATEYSMSAAVRFFMTKISAFAPSRSKARAMSYSQLVPGNTGMTAFGWADLCLHTATEGLSQEMGATVSVVPALVG